LLNPSIENITFDNTRPYQSLMKGIHSDSDVILGVVFIVHVPTLTFLQELSNTRRARLNLAL